MPEGGFCAREPARGCELPSLHLPRYHNRPPPSPPHQRHCRFRFRWFSASARLVVTRPLAGPLQLGEDSTHVGSRGRRLLVAIALKEEQGEKRQANRWSESGRRPLGA